MTVPPSDPPAGIRRYRFALAGLAVAAFAVSSAAASGWQRTENVWSRIVEHTDGTRTLSKQDVRTNTLEEATYDANEVLIKRRLFQLDDLGKPRLAMLFDGKSNLLARTEYFYDEYGELKEEVLFNTRGQLMRRLVYGLSGGIDSRPVAFTYDPSKPKAAPVKSKNAEPVMPAGLAPNTGGAAIPGGSKRALPSPGRATSTPRSGGAADDADRRKYQRR